LYSDQGRPSIAPEFLIRASLLQVFFSIRSERQLMEQLDYNLLFRWFVGLTMDESVWDPSTFSKNRDRLAAADVGRGLLDSVLGLAKRKGLTSNEHFSVDGTLIAGWASQKSVRRKDRSDDDDADGERHSAGRNFHGEKRSNETHASRTDPEALLARKSKAHPARPSYTGHVLMENRNGLVVGAQLTQATGTAERDAALSMAAGLPKRSTIGGDKGYDTAGFVAALRAMGIRPHVAQNVKRPGGSAIDGRTTRHLGYALSQKVRKRIEEIFGWGKEVGLLRQFKVRGVRRAEQVYLLVMSAWNLTRMRTIYAS
jgi:transposase